MTLGARCAAPRRIKADRQAGTTDSTLVRIKTPSVDRMRVAEAHSKWAVESAADSAEQELG